MPAPKWANFSPTMAPATATRRPLSALMSVRLSSTILFCAMLDPMPPRRTSQHAHILPPTYVQRLGVPLAVLNPTATVVVAIAVSISSAGKSPCKTLQNPQSTHLSTDPNLWEKASSALWKSSKLVVDDSRTRKLWIYQWLCLTLWLVVADPLHPTTSLKPHGVGMCTLKMKVGSISGKILQAFAAFSARERRGKGEERLLKSSGMLYVVGGFGSSILVDFRGSDNDTWHNIRVLFGFFGDFH